MEILRWGEKTGTGSLIKRGAGPLFFIAFFSLGDISLGDRLEFAPDKK